MTSAKHRGLLLTTGQGGHMIYYPSRQEGSLSYGQSTLSGYYSDIEKAAAHSADELAIGAVCIDKLPALDTAAGYKHVFSGPMVNVDLADGDCDPLPETSSIFAAAMIESRNQFGALLSLHTVQKATQPTKRGGLDSVSISEYAAGWEAVGARIGRWNGQSIDWLAPTGGPEMTPSQFDPQHSA